MQQIHQIIEQTALVFGCTPADILARSRKQPIVEARQAAMWAVRRRYPSIPLETIGATIGGRHYTTVMHALAAVERRAVQNARYRERLRQIVEHVTPVIPQEPLAQEHPVSIRPWWTIQR